jgi:hypothetical protein
MSIFLSYPLKLIEDKLDDKACLFLSTNINLCKIIFDDRGLIPLSDAPRPAPPSTPMSQAIRSQIRDIPQDQPSLPPISKR